MTNPNFQTAKGQLLCLEDIVSFEPGWIFLWELKIFKIEDDFGGKRFCNLV